MYFGIFFGKKPPTTPQQSKSYGRIYIKKKKGARYDYILPFLKHFMNVLFLNRTMKDGQKNYNKSAKNTGQIGDTHQSAWEANTTQWKGKAHTIMHSKDKDLYYNKGFIFKVSKRWGAFWSFVFLILYFKRKGDNLYRIGSLLFSYNLFLYQETAVIFSQSCITSGPKDWDGSVSVSFRDIKILSHLEINPSVEKLYELSTQLWSKA